MGTASLGMMLGLAILGQSAVENPGGETLPPHPRLLMNAEEIGAMKARIEREPWAAAHWKALWDEAATWIDAPVELPPRGGNWWHWYVCPKHGAVLKTGKRTGPCTWEHVCSVDGEAIPSDPSRPDADYDGCMISGEHSGWARRVRDLGVLFQGMGDARYAAKARDILMAYAERYADYPLHTIHGKPEIGGGRVGPQTLDEAVWLIPMAQGADLVWDTLSEDERRVLADRLFEPAAREVILPHRMGVDNIQCWKNSAVGLAGYLLDDAELVREAIDNPDRGYLKQMAEGVAADGAWWEGAWGYHFYTLSALWPLTEAARHAGRDLYGAPLRGMFEAPLRLRVPNWQLPAFNDSGEVDLLGEADLYELAYARYRAAEFEAPILAGKRDNDFALWYGEPLDAKAEPVAWTSTNHPGSGYAVLARGNGADATWCCLKYGPHGGGHGHPDKLSFVLYAAGAVRSPDPGTARYGAPIQKGWYRTTLAHNALVVDEKTQRPAEGACLAFGSESGADYVMAEAGPIYDGVRHVRTAVLFDATTLCFVDQIMCDEEYTLDVAYHQRGAWRDVPAGESWTPPETPGYEYLRDASIRDVAGSIGLTIEEDADRIANLTIVGDGPWLCIAATGVGAHVEDRVPTVILRRKARAAVYAWGISFGGESLALTPLPVATPNAAAWAVALPGSQTRTVVANPDGQPVRVTLPNGDAKDTNAKIAIY